MPNDISGVRIAILATDGVEEVELTEPRKAFDEAGAQTVLISVKPGKIQSMKHDEKSKKYKVDATFENSDPEAFDAVLLPGGALNADALRVVSSAQDFVRSMNDAGKPIAFICHAPWLLISADLVDGRTLSGYHTIQDDIRNAGGEWEDEEVVRDENWVSSREPSDIPAFNREMIALFGESRKDKSRDAA